MKKRVIAVFDVGKTNKKLFLFDEQYHVVLERSVHFAEIVDEDGDPTEDLESLRSWVVGSLKELSQQSAFDIRAINFAAYGASLVYVDDEGQPIAPLYNYLKGYPNQLQRQFYETYGGEEAVASATASPVLGSLNSGMQLYRIKHEQPALFKRMRYALHLPQYLSFLVSRYMHSDITSIGCHTQLWDFGRNDYHDWVRAEGLGEKLAPLRASDRVYPAPPLGNGGVVGVGLHDSSAALIPYLMSFKEPFVLLSTGTWSISFNPFNLTPLTRSELKADCLCYMQYQGTPVKAARLFAGYEHEQQVKRIASHFGQSPDEYRKMAYRANTVSALRQMGVDPVPARGDVSVFPQRNLSDFANGEEAYHRLVMDLVAAQVASTGLVMKDTGVKQLFVDGGFSKNEVFMNLLADAFPRIKVFGASMAQATAVGAALAIHQAWNSRSVPSNLVDLRFYPGSQP